MQAFRNLSIRTKLILLLVGACVTVLVAACGAFVAYDRVSYGEAKAQTLGVLTDSIALTLVGPVAFQDAGSTSTVLGNLEAEPTAVSAAAYTAEGKRLAEWNRDPDAHMPEALPGGVYPVGDDSLVLQQNIGADGQIAGKLVVVYSTADIQARLEQFLKIAGVVMLLSLAMAFTVALSTHGLISSPVKSLAGAASKVQKDGDYTIRAEVSQSDEIGLLAQAFNNMLEDIQARDDELTAHRDHLEAIVAERTRNLDRRNAAMRLVLDNVDQAIVTIGIDGVMESERSKAFDTFFDAPAQGASLAAHLGRSSDGFHDWFALSWESITDGWLPLELCIDQLPKRFEADGKHFTLSYKPIYEGDELKDMLVVITDVSAEVERRAVESRQREFIAVFEAMSKDRAGFEDFLREADTLVAHLSPAVAEADLAAFKRRVHTLKGNSAIYGLHSIARLCHTVEDGMESTGAAPAEEDLQPVIDAWSTLRVRIDTVAGKASASGSVSSADWDDLRAAVLSGVDRKLVAAQITRLAADPVGPRLTALAGRAENMAERLGKSVAVTVDDGALRLPREPWVGLWNSLVHVVRNAVDHGVEAADVREAAGKPAAGRLVVSTKVVPGRLVVRPGLGVARCGVLQAGAQAYLEICIADDGAGVNWDGLRTLADKRGLDAQTPAELASLMFSDGVSTRQTTTETSGRGVGTAAVLAEVTERGGCIDVASNAGEGTSFRFILPLEARFVPVQRIAAA